MNSEDQFWAIVCKIFGVAICVLIVSVASCSSYENYVTLDAVKHGVDPLRFKCATSSSATAMHFCDVLATREAS